MTGSGSEPEWSAAAPRKRVSRRVRRDAAPGVDPRPSEHPLDARAREDRPEGWGESAAPGAATGANDDRLKRDRPPHWG